MASLELLMINKMYRVGVRGGSRTAATSKMEGLKPLTIITKRSILNVAAVLDPPLGVLCTFTISTWKKKLVKFQFHFLLEN